MLFQTMEMSDLRNAGHRVSLCQEGSEEAMSLRQAQLVPSSTAEDEKLH